MLLMEKVGGYTQAIRNADSWEGWYWGAEHVWGEGAQGHSTDADNVLYDITQHSKMLIAIGCDLETTPWGFGGQFPTNVCYFWNDLGIKQISIAPDLNYYAGVHADKWIPILPNTDAALHLAVAYTWIAEGTYDKDYVATHVVGFEPFRAYVMGEEDGVPKTPAWAAEKTGVSEWTIKALARAVGQAGDVHPALLRRLLHPRPLQPRAGAPRGMSRGHAGHGQTGRARLQQDGRRAHAARHASSGDPAQARRHPQPGVERPPAAQRHEAAHPQDPAAPGHPGRHLHFLGNTSLYAHIEDQFKKYTYPIPKEEGGSEVHMMWMDNPCRSTCWNNSMESIQAFRSPKLETIVVQHPWLENDTIYADIILPVNTKLEERDFAQISSASPMNGIAIEEKAIEPLGESLSDYEAAGEVAKKLGLYDEYTDKLTIDEKIKWGYEVSGCAEAIS